MNWDVLRREYDALFAKAAGNVNARARARAQGIGVFPVLAPAERKLLQMKSANLGHVTLRLVGL